jgi:hypothetical protein
MKKGTIFTSTEGEASRVQIAIYEKHELDEVGSVMRHELTLYEMHHLHELLTDALWTLLRKQT